MVAFPVLFRVTTSTLTIIECEKMLSKKLLTEDPLLCNFSLVLAEQVESSAILTIILGCFASLSEYLTHFRIRKVECRGVLLCQLKKFKGLFLARRFVGEPEVQSTPTASFHRALEGRCARM